MNALIHVGFAFPGVPKMRDLEPIMSAIADDWIRYSSTNWILWTSRTAPEILNVIFTNIDPQDNVLVSPFDAKGCIGRLPQWAWTWLNTKGAEISTGSAVYNALMGFPALPKPSGY